jgi:hypothetical protein
MVGREDWLVVVDAGDGSEVMVEGEGRRRTVRRLNFSDGSGREFGVGRKRSSEEGGGVRGRVESGWKSWRRVEGCKVGLHHESES